MDSFPLSCCHQYVTWKPVHSGIQKSDNVSSDRFEDGKLCEPSRLRRMAEEWQEAWQFQAMWWMREHEFDLPVVILDHRSLNLPYQNRRYGERSSKTC